MFEREPLDIQNNLNLQQLHDILNHVSLCFCFAVKEDCGSEEEDEEEGEEGEEEEGGKDALVEEMLQLGDTAVIYPEAPEDEQKSMPERRVPDENGTSLHRKTRTSFFYL